MASKSTNEKPAQPPPTDPKDEKQEDTKKEPLEMDFLDFPGTHTRVAIAFREYHA